MVEAQTFTKATLASRYMTKDTPPTADQLFVALDATWPAAANTKQDGWLLRDGAGGGKRVSAASRLTPDAGVAAAVEAMRAMGQTPMFQVRGEEVDLDTALEAAGYKLVDPVWLYAAPVGDLIDGESEQSRVYRGQFAVAAMQEIWAKGGIGPARLAVMERAAAPKSWLMTRIEDRPAGVAFVSVSGDVAMVHAIEVAGAYRRRGAAHALMSGAATFAADNGANWLALAVTKANLGATSLYQSLGMEVVAGYHYRVLIDGE